MTIRISAALLGQIREHGRENYPLECCGLLLGIAREDGKQVNSLRLMKNSRTDSASNRYLIEPTDLLVAERDARRAGQDILGVYHSHPDHPARPSEYDREHAFPWYSYLIVSVMAGEAEDLQSWVLKEDRSAFDPEDLVVY